MVDLDKDSLCSSAEWSQDASISDDEAYRQTENFLLNNLFAFTLRKRYLKASEMVHSLYAQFSAQIPPLFSWCLLAMQSTPSTELPTTCVTHSPSYRHNLIVVRSQRDWYESLISMAEELLSCIDASTGRFQTPLEEYCVKARRLVIHIHLEEFEITGDHAAFILQLNRHFPARNTMTSANTYRSKLAKLLLCQARTAHYLQKRWYPNHVEAMTDVSRLAGIVADQFPEVLFDKIDTNEVNKQILLHLNTALSLNMRDFFLNSANDCRTSEEDILHLIQSITSDSIPSQLLY